MNNSDQMRDLADQVGRQASTPGDERVVFNDHAIAIYVWCPERGLEWSALAETTWGISVPDVAVWK